jgi:hypothetical protein
MKRKYRLRREAAYREGVESYASLVREATFRDFLCLYIAEGYKRSRHTVSICNSEPSVMLLADGWSRRLTRRAVDYVVTHHPDQRAEQLTHFWSEYLDVPQGAFAANRKPTAAGFAGASGAAGTECWRSALTTPTFEPDSGRGSI